LIDPELKQTDNLADVNKNLSEELMSKELGVTTSVFNNEEKIISYATLSNGQILLITSSKHDIYSEVNKLTNTILIVLFAMIILAIIIALIVGRKISKPLNTLISDMGKVNDGNFTVRTTIKN